MKTPSVVRTVYLYLFSLIGLCLIVIGGVRLVDMGLKAFIFTAADESRKISMTTPPYPPTSDAKLSADKDVLTEEDKAAIERWRVDYENWKTVESKRDYVKEERSRNAAESIALILVGLPLYFYHWSTVRKEHSKKDE